MDMNMETNQISATISAKEDQTLTFGELTEWQMKSWKSNDDRWH